MDIQDSIQTQTPIQPNIYSVSWHYREKWSYTRMHLHFFEAFFCAMFSLLRTSNEDKHWFWSPLRELDNFSWAKGRRIWQGQVGTYKFFGPSCIPVLPEMDGKKDCLITKDICKSCSFRLPFSFGILVLV